MNIEDEMVELLPCPFCDGEAEMSYYARGTSAEPAGHFVECITCSAAGPGFDIQGEDPDREDHAKSKAREGWNTRPLPVREKVLEEALEAVDWDFVEGAVTDYLTRQGQFTLKAIAPLRRAIDALKPSSKSGEGVS